VAIDYDPGASEVNQLNRIKLMISTAFENLEEASPQQMIKNIQEGYEQAQEVVSI
ncbi:MAG: putative CoA-substrate-specific enzyme activase, partial [Clostridia bacterium]|nr:putative CoA-substrate-specific enzyme activase [Clostridia bacterium]